MKKPQKTLALWFVIILLTAFIMKVLDQKPAHIKQLSFSDFIGAVKEGNVESVSFQRPDNITGKYKADFENGTYFESVGYLDSEYYTKLLSENGLIINYKKEEKQGLLSTILLNWLFPMLLLFVIFYFFLRQIQAGGGKAMSFGKSRAKMLNESDKKVTFSDVAGVDEAKEELEEVVDFLRSPKKYTALGGKIPKGVLLIGPPGTGKTLLAKAVAGEAGVPFFSISGSDFVEMFVGVGASRVRDLFEQGKKHAPCIIFIDEIDAVGRHRGAGLGGGHDEREQTLNQLLVEMDGFESNEGVILIAATNRIDVLDPALLRPGRFDRRVTVGRPDLRGRHKILQVHTAKTPVSDSVDLEVIAKGTPGFTGADLANLVNEAALLAARENKKHLDNIDFENAKDKVLMGVARKSLHISDDEKRVTAYHEAGHTLVGLTLPHTDPIHKVTIIPRGGALGVTQTLPDEDKLNMSRERAENFIAFLMGGRCAEELIFGQMTNGASNDIERATELAYNMVCNWGMSKSLGPISFGKSRSNPFVGMQGSEFENNVSEETAIKIDHEIYNLVQKNYEHATKILTEQKEVLVRLSEALILWETLDSDQVRRIVEGEDIGQPTIDKTNKDDNNKGSSKAKSKKEENKKEFPSGGKIVTARKNMS
ncbi:MAG: ATP-dependent metallopeptidase FtsH/Yme1/Tma family protein [Halobacteriovoraceae bacterium]|nr:ATP-dependent metallopeptidase FtsH/Yme1/Tma family protein [Halobacteriovoraceae bacterium]